ncbi:MAG TPA: hypothetical protein VGD43_01800 [Micromonospora sp.]
MSFVPGVPGHAPLVVRSNRATRVLYVVMLVATGLEVVLVGAIPAFALWLGSPGMALIAAPLLVQLYVTALVVREYQGLLGPQLAADHTGVWVRTGLGRRPEAVHLPWAAVDGVDTAKGPVVRVLSRQGEALFPARPHWRVRSLRRRFGTAFVVDGRRSLEPVDVIAHRLAQWRVASRRP